MTYPIDLLGRPPIMNDGAKAGEALETLSKSDDWKGEHFWHVKRNIHGGGLYNFASNKCVVDGCGAGLAPSNKTSVCKKHMHRPGVCQCGHCLAGNSDQD